MSGKDRWFIFVYVMVPVVVILGFMITKDREKYYENIFLLGPNDHYSVREFSANEFGISQEGQLGEMYQCLTQYRSGLDKKAPEVVTGPSGDMKLYVGFYEIYLDISQGEVTSTGLTKYKSDGSMDYASSSLAVNCNVKLLNKFDKNSRTVATK